MKVTNCDDCPFKKDHYGHGECWAQCNHPESTKKFYDAILWGCQEESLKEPPYWCALRKGPYIVSL